MTTWTSWKMQTARKRESSQVQRDDMDDIDKMQNTTSLVERGVTLEAASWPSMELSASASYVICVTALVSEKLPSRLF